MGQSIIWLWSGVRALSRSRFALGAEWGAMSKKIHPTEDVADIRVVDKNKKKQREGKVARKGLTI